MGLFNRLVWALPGCVHTAVWWVTGWRLVKVVYGPGRFSFRWSREYPLDCA
jgi:hypothetical protein